MLMEYRCNTFRKKEKEFIPFEFNENKEERYSRVPRLSYLPRELVCFAQIDKRAPRVTSTCLVSLGHLFVLLVVHQRPSYKIILKMYC